MVTTLLETVRDWGFSHFVEKGNGEDSKAITGRYNVLDYGVKNDGVTDNTTALQNLINQVSEGSVVFFPKGVYVITDEISIPRSMTFEGVPVFGNQITHGNPYAAKSQITLIGTKENISMFNVTASWAEFSVCNLAFIGNSYHTSFVDKNTAWVSAPTHIIVEKERNNEDSDLMYIRDGINGITHLNGGGIAMRNCMFAGFSGYGTTIGTSQDIHDCVFYECKIGIKELEYDSKIRRCWFSRGETAILCSWERERAKYNTEPVGDKDAKGNSKGIRYYLTLQVTDCWCDMMRGHFIHVESKTPNEAYHTVKLLVNDNWVDMLDSSAIYVDGTITQSSITGSFSRIGMMWANTNGDARTATNASECDIVNAYAIHNSDIHVTTEMWNYANGQKRRLGHDRLHSTFRSLICPTKVASARNNNLMTETDIVAYDAPLENITDNAYGMRNVRISCGKTDITRQKSLDLSQLYILSPSNSLPAASKEWLGMTVLLTANSSVYVKGAFYQCVASTASENTTYSWERVDKEAESILAKLASLEESIVPTYPTMPSVNDLMKLPNNQVFVTEGYYAKGDGGNGKYLISDTASLGALKITSSTERVRYLSILGDDGTVENVIDVTKYGIRTSPIELDNNPTVENTYARINSAIVSNIYGFSLRANKNATLKFGFGKYVFENPISIDFVNLKGATQATTFSPIDYNNHNVSRKAGTWLCFPFLTDGDNAVHIVQGDIEDICFYGSFDDYDIVFDRTKTITATDEVVTETANKQCTGLYLEDRGNVKNVAFFGFYEGLRCDTGNIYINNLYASKCHFGMNIFRDTKCIGIYGFNVHTMATIRGSVSAITQLRVDSCVNAVNVYGGHCVNLYDIDGDYCTESLITIGNPDGTGGNLTSAVFSGIHGRCCTLKANKATDPRVDVRTLSNTEGYGVIRLLDNAHILKSTFILNSNGGREPLDGDATYECPHIVLTFAGASPKIKDSMFIVANDDVTAKDDVLKMFQVANARLNNVTIMCGQDTYYMESSTRIRASHDDLEMINWLPKAKDSYLNKKYLLTGNQTGYVKGQTYECRAVAGSNPTTYEWYPLLDYIRTYSIMPTDAELLEMSDGTKFYAQGYYDILDGNGGYYKITTTLTDNSREITNGTKTVYLLPLNGEGHIDNIINVCRYGVRECAGSLTNKTAENTYATLNSNIIDSIVLPDWSVGGTWKFPKGRFYFERTIDLTARSRNIVGAETPRINDNVFTDAHIRCGTMLIFPFLNNGDSAIISGMGNVENIAILGDSANYDFSIDRTKAITAPNEVVTEVVKQVTEDGKTVDYRCTGLNKTNNGNVKNVAIANFYTGYTSDLTNIYVNHLNTLKCHIGVSVKNDIKCVGLYSWNVHTALQIRGSLVSVTQLRVDSCVNVVHISAKSSKVTLVDVDGDWCTEELIKIGDRESYVDVFESTFLAVHGRCNTLKSYAKTGGVKPSASTLNESNSEGYGLIRIVQKGKFHDNYVQCAGLGGNTFDNSDAYILPKILLTFENETVQKNNTFVINDEEAEDTTAYVESLIQLGWVTSCKFETSLNTYYVTSGKIVNSTPKETTVFPTASSRNVGQTYLYMGETTATYQKGGIYECQETSNNVYEWKLVNTPVAVVKDIVANATDFADFKSKIALI